MAWLVGVIIAAGAGTLGVLLSRVERVRISSATAADLSTAVDAGADDADVSFGCRQAG